MIPYRCAKATRPVPRHRFLTARVTAGVWAAWMAVFTLSPAPAQADAPTGVTPRVVSLSPNLTELVFALGLEAHLVGRSSACDYPDSVEAIPVVGGFGRPNWEALVAVRPDLVLCTDLEKPGIRTQLERRGVRVLALPCENWAGLKEAARAIATALDAPGAGDAWVSGLDARLASLRARTPPEGEGDARPSVYVEIWGNPIMTAGRQSFLHDVITVAGGRPLGASLDGRYVAVSSEWIIREQPDWILLAYMLAEVQASTRIRGRLGWSSIPAVAAGRIIEAIHPDQLLRPGPRLIEGAEQLAEYLHGADHSADLRSTPAY